MVGLAHGRGVVSGTFLTKTSFYVEATGANREQQKGVGDFTGCKRYDCNQLLKAFQSQDTQVSYLCCIADRSTTSWNAKPFRPKFLKLVLTGTMTRVADGKKGVCTAVT